MNTPPTAAPTRPGTHSSAPRSKLICCTLGHAGARAPGGDAASGRYLDCGLVAHARRASALGHESGRGRSNGRPLVDLAWMGGNCSVSARLSGVPTVEGEPSWARRLATRMRPLSDRACGGGRERSSQPLHAYSSHAVGRLMLPVLASWGCETGTEIAGVARATATRASDGSVVITAALDCILAEGSPRADGRCDADHTRVCVEARWFTRRDPPPSAQSPGQAAGARTCHEVVNVPRCAQARSRPTPR
jgi:hypothetical protein